jgi:diadenosine tetraphosphate (Ap4A) HIT family hydrolase
MINKKYVLIYTYMKHLKKFENSEYDEYQNDISEIKDILKDLKDEYPEIDGELYPFNSIDKSVKGITLMINTNKLIPGDIFSTEYSKLKLELIKSILEALERIEKALSKKCRIINIWNCGQERDIQINIV